MDKTYCYTNVSPSILICINPYKRLVLLDEFEQANKDAKQQTPNPYAMASLSYTRLNKEKINQSIVICGESGTGKVESISFEIITNYN